jgi:hypothetical protein
VHIVFEGSILAMVTRKKTVSIMKKKTDDGSIGYLKFHMDYLGIISHKALRM